MVRISAIGEIVREIGLDKRDHRMTGTPGLGHGQGQRGRRVPGLPVRLGVSHSASERILWEKRFLKAANFSYL